MSDYWNRLGWNSTNFGLRFPNASSGRCGVAQFMHDCEVNLDEIPLTSNVNSPMLHSATTKVCPFHVIFNLNKIIVTTCFNKHFCTIICHHGLKEFLEKCLVQFQVYILFIAQNHNIYNYLSQNINLYTCFQSAWSRVLHAKTTFLTR